MLEGARRLDRVPTTFGEQPRHHQQTHVVMQLLCGLLLKRPQRRVLLFHGQGRGEDEVCDAWRPPGTTHEVLVGLAGEPHPPQVPPPLAERQL